MASERPARKLRVLYEGLLAADPNAMTVEEQLAQLKALPQAKQEDGKVGRQVRAQQTIADFAKLLEDNKRSIIIDLAICNDGGWLPEALAKRGPQGGVIGVSPMESLAAALEGLPPCDPGVMAVVTACCLKRAVADERIVINRAIWRYDVDPSLVAIGVVPGEKLALVGSISIHAPGVDDEARPNADVLHDAAISLRLALQLAIDPPSYDQERVIWNNVYNIGMAIISFRALLDATRRSDFNIRVRAPAELGGADADDLVLIWREGTRLRVLIGEHLLRHMFVGQLLVALARTGSNGNAEGTGGDGDAERTGGIGDTELLVVQGDLSAYTPGKKVFPLLRVFQQGSTWNVSGSGEPDLLEQPHVRGIMDALRICCAASGGVEEAGGVKEREGVEGSGRGAAYKNSPRDVRWSRRAALQRLAVMLAANPGDPAVARQWRLLVVCAAACELADTWEDVFHLLYYARVVDSCKDSEGDVDVAWGAPPELAALATAILQFKTLKLGAAEFDPTKTRPFNLTGHDHEAPGVLKRPRTTRSCVDGMNVGRGRGDELARGDDTLRVRVKGGRFIKVTLEDGVLFSTRAFEPKDLLQPFTRIVGLNVLQVVEITWAPLPLAPPAPRTKVSGTLFKALLQGCNGPEPAGWLLDRIFNGEVALRRLSPESRQPTFLTASPRFINVTFNEDSPYSAEYTSLDADLLCQLHTYEDGTHVWLDLFNDNSLRRVTRVVEWLLELQPIEFSGDHELLSECSFTGHYKLR
ncbi:hypothetical protein JKP88DRAFT_307366 [Tribonema minus]|uniref:Uncharacterized protein n=1 Tax=Tribonema minus TaxID=303371 RepID=A0A836CIG6_9STRA|nr:hypothetical protein JKP88DRAFT_307366 [Tribonema minus]